MLDMNIIRQRPEWVKEQLSKRGELPPIDQLLTLDGRRKELLLQVEALRGERNAASKAIGILVQQLKQAQKAGDAEAAAKLEVESAEAKARPSAIGEQLLQLEEELRQTEEAFAQLQMWIPNLPHESTPVGPDESYNIAHAPQGDLPVFSFEPKPHWELGTALDIIDFERGVKLSGSRFYVLKGWGARLQRAVIQFMLDLHTTKHGCTEIYPPFIVRSKNFEGAGQLPKFFDNIYRDAEEDLMLLGTAEIALTNLHRDEVLEEAVLPIKYVAYTPCFRREKMSAGKDVRGIKRGHQFDKVEMYQFVHPDASYQALEELKQFAIDVAEALGFRYRLIELVTGDIGFSMTKTYDIEIWAAGCQEWLEVSSISNAEDFQARRANIKYRPKEGGKLQYPHTLNASGLALPRVMIGILENNQQEDGSILIPPVLRPYLGGAERIPA